MWNPHTLWWAATPFLPALALQGIAARLRTPRLPEAAGPRQGWVQPPQANSQANARIPPAQRPLNLLVLGESTAAGVGADDQAQGIAVQLAEQLATRSAMDVRWQVLGQTGLTLAQVRRQLLQPTRPPGRPLDIALVLIGVNDVVRLTPERVWVREPHGLIADLHPRARHIVFTGVPPVGSFTALPRPLQDVLGVRATLLDLRLQHVAASHLHTTHIPTSAPVGPQLARDGFHPSPSGYAGWAESLAQALGDLPRRLVDAAPAT